MAATRRRRTSSRRRRRISTRTRRYLHQVLGALAVVAAGAAGLGALAGVLSGGAWPWVIATYLRWPQVVVLLVATTVLFAVRWWRSAILSAVVAAGLVASVAAPLMALETVDAPSARTLRVVLFNTGAANDDIAAIAAAVRSADPDVAILLESDDVADRVVARIDGLSRLPVPTEPARHAPPIVLARRDWPITVELLGDARPATIVTVELEGRPVDIVAAHPLPPVTREWAQRHDSAIAALSRSVRALTRPHALACDCNTSPWTPSMRRLLDAGLRQPTVAATFGAPAIGIPIDHILLSRDVVAVSRGLGPFAGSDHRLIVTEIALARRSGGT